MPSLALLEHWTLYRNGKPTAETYTGSLGPAYGYFCGLLGLRVAVEVSTASPGSWERLARIRLGELGYSVERIQS